MTVRLALRVQRVGRADDRAPAAVNDPRTTGCNRAAGIVALDGGLVLGGRLIRGVIRVEIWP